MAEVGLGLIGVGWWGGELAAAARRTQNARVVACYSRDPSRRQAFAVEHGCRAVDGVEALVTDPQVEGVLVVTPHSTHLALIEAAAAAGRPVFVEKPLTLTLDEARAALAATERAGVTLQAGHHRRRLGATRRLRRLLDEGVIGTPVALECNHSGPNLFGRISEWRKDPEESPVGGMTAFGVHVLDTLHYLVGPIRRVTALSTSVLGIGDLDDVSVMTFQHQSGPLSTLTTSLAVPKTATVGLFGSDAAAWSLHDGARLAVQRRSEPVPTVEDVDPGDALADQLAEFARCIRDGASPETGGPQGAAVVAVLDAIETSARSGCAVDVPTL